MGKQTGKKSIGHEDKRIAFQLPDKVSVGKDGDKIGPDESKRLMLGHSKDIGR